MVRQQRGVTFVGWLFLLVPVAIVAYVAIRLIPIYLNYMRVARALDQSISETRSDEGGGSLTQLRVAIDRHFEIDSIEYPNSKDLVIRKDGKNWVVEAKYEEEAPLFGNLSILVKFDKIAQGG